MTMSSNDLAQIVGQNTARYVTVGAMAGLIFDYCITFGSEVKLVWGTRWNATRIIFTISRYLVFAGSAMTVYAALANRAGQNCHRFNTASNVIHIASIVSAECLLIMRTYAFWQRSKVVLYFLVAFACFCLGGAMGFMKLANNLLPPTSSDQSGCTFQSTRSSAIQYIFLVAFELTLLGLNVYKRKQTYKGSRSYLIETLYYDGVLYMLCIMVASTLNIFIAFFIEGSYANVMNVPQLVLHSVLASRIFFSLRGNYQSRRDNYGVDIRSDLSTLQAPSNPVMRLNEYGSMTLVLNASKDWESAQVKLV